MFCWFVIKSMIVKFALFLLITLQVNAEQCKKLLGELANSEMLFAHCATTHSVPVNICIGCKEQYDSVNQAYATLKNETNCTSMYFDKDRINLVAATEAALTSLWTKAYCNDCYGNENFNTFDEKSTTFQGCINKNPKNPCDKCMLQYLDLNNFYILLDQHNNGQVCFDMQDSMNRSRNLWSNELKCCRREYNVNLFTVALCIVSCLPFLFYGGTYLVTKRQERNHGILNDEDPLFNSSTPSTSSAAATIHVRNNSAASPSLKQRNDIPQPSATLAESANRPQSSKGFNKLNEEISESSDEDNLANKK